MIGSEANSNRYFAASDSRETAAREYMNYYRTDYGEINPAQSPVFEDDRDKNRLLISESYEIVKPWKPDDSDPGWFKFPVYLREIRDRLSGPAHPFRTTPFAFPHPRRISQTIEIHLTDPEEWEFEEEDHFVESSAFTLRRNVTFDLDAGILKVQANFESLSDHIMPTDLESHVDAIEAAYELTRYEIWSLDENTAIAPGVYSEETYSEPQSGRSPTAFLIGLGIGIAAGIGGILLVLIFLRNRK